MSPLSSWLLLVSLLVVVIVPVWALCRAVERRHVPHCVCDGCMAESQTWHPSFNDNDRAQVGARPVVSSHLSRERFRL